jgi:hypothetical protein
MLIVVNKPIVLSVMMLSVIMLNVVAPFKVLLSLRKSTFSAIQS